MLVIIKKLKKKKRMHGTCIKIRDLLYIIDPHAYVVVDSKRNVFYQIL